MDAYKKMDQLISQATIRMNEMNPKSVCDDEPDKDMLTEEFFKDAMLRKGYDLYPALWTKIMERMAKDTIRKGWILNGGTGVGKTLRARLAAWACNLGRKDNPALWIEVWRATELSAMIVQAEGNMSDVYRAYHVSGSRLSEGVRFKGMDLIIDDLGSEPSKVMVFGSEVNPMREMLELRLEMFPQIKTYITTNLTAREIEERYGERVASRLESACAWVHMEGHDRRREANK